MSAKAILVLCAQALLAQVAFSACVYPAGPSIGAAPCGVRGGNLGYGAGIGYGASINNGCGNGYAGAGLSAASIEVAPTSGGALPVSFSSAIAPSGLSVASDNVYEGSLNVIGDLPFLSAVALEGAFPSAGESAVNYSCGNGITAVTSNSGYSAGSSGLGSAGNGYGAIGYGLGAGAYLPTAGLGLAGHGYGCGCEGY